MKSYFCLFALLVINVPSLRAEKHKDIQQQILDEAPIASDAVIAIQFWTIQEPEKNIPVLSSVIGTGFLVDDEGDFVTAAHVLKLTSVGPENNPYPVYLTAVIRQRSGDGMGARFKVLEIDHDHDLALCHIDNFHVYTPAESPTAKGTRLAKQSGMPGVSCAAGLSLRLAAVAEGGADILVAHQSALLLETYLQLVHHGPVGVAEVVPAEVRDSDRFAGRDEMVLLQRPTPIRPSGEDDQLGMIAHGIGHGIGLWARL